VFLDALVQVAGCHADIASVALATLKFVNNALLTHNLWLGFLWSKIFANFSAREYWLNWYPYFTCQII
jgi:hypothetical protein